VKTDNIAGIAQAGADTFVAGSAIFGTKDYTATINAMRAALATGCFSAEFVLKFTLPLQVKAVMIDLDGTLLDTIPDLAAATNMMLVELKMPALPESSVRNYVGKGINNLIERAPHGQHGRQA